MGVPLEEIKESTGIAKTTVHHLLYLMIKLGYVEQDSVTYLYALSGRCFEPGINALPHQRLTLLAKPFMQSLLLTFGESLNLAVRHHGVATYIADWTARSRIASRIESKEEGVLRRRCRHRPVQYLNNILKQDRRAIKKRIRC